MCLLVLSQADGFTYERSAIERWFENHDTDPETGATLESKLLIPNRRLRSMIREFQERQLAAAQPAPPAPPMPALEPAPVQQPAWAAMLLEPQAGSSAQPPTAAAAPGGRGGRGAPGGRGGRGAGGGGSQAP